MEDRFVKLLKMLVSAVVAVLAFLLLIVSATVYFNFFYDPADFISAKEKALVTNIDLSDVQNGTHKLTGLKVDTHLELVIANCTGCHSAKLIAQNKATKEGWKNTITWMQETQNLWDLGENEEKIIEYLAKNYAPEPQGRRKPLENIEWYELD